MATEGWYKISIRVATNMSSGGPFSILFNDVALYGPFTVLNTGGWDKFVNLETPSAYLYPTDTLMRVAFAGGGFNISNLTFQPGQQVSLPGKDNAPGITIFPNPAVHTALVQSSLGMTRIKILDTAGKLLYDAVPTQEHSHTIHLESYREGLYLVLITFQDHTTRAHKIIKSTKH